MIERLSPTEQNKLARGVIKDIRSTGDSENWGFLLQKRQELGVRLKNKELENEELMIFLSLTVGLRDTFGKHYGRVIALWERRRCYPFSNLAK